MEKRRPDPSAYAKCQELPTRGVLQCRTAVLPESSHEARMCVFDRDPRDEPIRRQDRRLIGIGNGGDHLSWPLRGSRDLAGSGPQGSASRGPHHGDWSALFSTARKRLGVSASVSQTRTLIWSSQNLLGRPGLKESLTANNLLATAQIYSQTAMFGYRSSLGKGSRQ